VFWSLACPTLTPPLVCGFALALLFNLPHTSPRSRTSGDPAYVPRLSFRYLFFETAALSGNSSSTTPPAVRDQQPPAFPAQGGSSRIVHDVSASPFRFVPASTDLLPPSCFPKCTASLRLVLFLPVFFFLHGVGGLLAPHSWITQLTRSLRQFSPAVPSSLYFAFERLDLCGLF